MMRSMFSGVSGLRVHQMKMDVIANNIANVNTHGYKTSRMTFTDVFNQTLQGATGSNPAQGRGGTNPSQIGLGANIGSIDMIMTQGTPQRTDAAWDLFIEGEGFFVVTDASGTYFTRNGAFHLDNLDYVSNSSGQVLNGWKAQPSTTEPGEFEVPKTPAGPIQFTAEDKRIQATATSYITMEGNLDAIVQDRTEPTEMNFYDSLGNMYTMEVWYEFRAQGDTLADGTTVALEDCWEVMTNNRMYRDGEKGDGGTSISFTARTDAITENDFSGDIPGSWDIAIDATPVDVTEQGLGVVRFDDSGDLATYPDETALGGLTGLQLFIETTTDGSDIDGDLLEPDATFKLPINIDFTTLSGVGGSKTTSSIEASRKDGNAPGTLIGYSVGTDGKITGRYTNSEEKVLYQICLAQFVNPAGLEKYGNNLFVQTMNSGSFDGIGVEAGAGVRILGGTLEMANVDLAQEFTEMITAQRGFQANSRTITTSDEMLQELVNLKR